MVYFKVPKLRNTAGVLYDPEFKRKYNLKTSRYATTERSLADMIIDKEFKLLQGMHRDYPLTDKELIILFKLTKSLKDPEIDAFMEKEYGYLYTYE